MWSKLTLLYVQNSTIYSAALVCKMFLLDSWVLCWLQKIKWVPIDTMGSWDEIARRGSRFGFQIRGSYSLWGRLSDIGQLSYWRRWSDRGQLSYRGVRVTAASCHNGGDRVVRTRSHTGGFLVALVLKREFDFLLFWRKWNFAEGYRIMGQDEWRSDFLCFKSNTNLES